MRVSNQGMANLVKKYILGFPEKGLDGEGGDYPNRKVSSNDYVLMQYTGLKDKDDKEIYEGDIVKVDFQGKKFFYNYVGEVEYSNGSFWCTKHNGYGGEKYTLNGLMNISLAPHTILNVIGNIYENSELLKS